MFEIKNIYKCKKELEKELDIKSTLKVTPQKIIIQMGNGLSVTVFPCNVNSNVDYVNSHENWRYIANTKHNIIFRDSINYDIRFRTELMHVNSIGYINSSEKEFNQIMSKIFEHKRLNIVLDYSHECFLKKIHMTGKFIDIKLLGFYHKKQNITDYYELQNITELEFSANEKYIKIEEESYEK